MTNAKHTPGSWAIENQDGLYVADKNSGALVAQIKDVDTGNGETLANARLIAAAPDLLLALEIALKFLQHNFPDDALSSEHFLMSTLKKAKGEAK